MYPQWQQCLHDFLRAMEVRSVQTRTSYATILGRFFASHDPISVTRRDVEEFMHTRFPDPHRKRQGKLAISTQNLRFSAISSFYRYASTYVPEGETEPLWIRAIPTVGITRGKPERSPKGLTLEELTRLFSVIPQTTLIGIRDRAVLLLTFWVARRRSEIAGLRYGDITETSFSDGHGGMRKAYVLAFRGKGHKSEIDHQEIPTPALDAVMWYLLASGRAETIKDSDPLFSAVGREPGCGGNVRPGEVRALSAKGIANRMAVYARQAGLHASLHTLRHSAARARFSAGASVRDVQQLLRHSSIGTTDIYLRTLIGVEDKTAKLLESEYGDL